VFRRVGSRWISLGRATGALPECYIRAAWSTTWGTAGATRRGVGSHELGGRTALDEDFALLLRRFRLRAALTQEQLAEHSGVSVHSVSVLEGGRRRPRLSSVSDGALGPV
jgi:DNA-binding XRE family transcriptional regulator